MRTIESPGVEIREVDLGNSTQLPVGTTTAVFGYAKQGPTDEVLNITSISELEQIHGTPTNAAESYFYYTCKEVLLANGNLITSRLPYGAGDGVTTGNKYSVLAYPFLPLDGSGNETSTYSSSSVSGYYIGEPVTFTMNESALMEWQEGGISFSNAYSADPNLMDNVTADNLKNIGLVVVNTMKSTIDPDYSGYYVTIADNSKIDKGSNFNSITGIMSIDENSTFVELNSDRLAFTLSGTEVQGADSVSENIENSIGWDFSVTGKNGFADSLVLSLFKVRPSLYNAESKILEKVFTENYVGSFDSTRKINSKNDGSMQNFFLEDVVNGNSNRLKVFVNPYISKNTLWFDPQTGNPTKTVRVISASKPNLDVNGNVIPENPSFPSQPTDTSILSAHDMTFADNMYALGTYTKCDLDANKDIGDVPQKLERALRLIEDRKRWRVDLVCEGGLGTVWTGMKLNPANYTDTTNLSPASSMEREIFDDTVNIAGILTEATYDGAAYPALSNQTEGVDSIAQDFYTTIYNIFNTFTGTTRKDCLYIADPLKFIFVQGNGSKTVLQNPTRNFPQHVYWPLKNLFNDSNSSYACTYANWVKVWDSGLGRFIWLPPSGYIANIMVKTDTNSFPWVPPAGLNRGIITDISGIAVNPTQKHCDLLYKMGLNPIVSWPEGNVVNGQKTLQRKPSPFDRINVRRGFLWMEKATDDVMRYFVMENNTVFTRSRVVGALTPIFTYVQNNDGVYEFKIICNEKNNPGDVIDRNEMVTDIYIKHVRAAEFVLVNFYATRTDTNFSEII